MRATFPSHLTHLNFFILTIFGEEYISLCALLCSLQPLTNTISRLSSRNIPHRALLSNTSPSSSLNDSGQVSHPSKTTDTIITKFIGLQYSDRRAWREYTTGENRPRQKGNIKTDLKEKVGCELDLSGSRWGAVAGSTEHSNELSGSVKWKKHIKEVRACQFLKEIHENFLSFLRKLLFNMLKTWNSVSFADLENL